MEIKNPEKPDEKQKRVNGRFAKGFSGNPAGKPKGTRHKVTQLMEKILSTDAEDLMKTAIDKALSGNDKLLCALLDRLLPPLKDRPLKTKLPKIESTGDAIEFMTVVIDQTAKGKLTASEAMSLSRLCDSHVQAVELHEIDERLKLLEEKTNETKR